MVLLAVNDKKQVLGQDAVTEVFTNIKKLLDDEYTKKGEGSSKVDKEVDDLSELELLQILNTK